MNLNLPIRPLQNQRVNFVDTATNLGASFEISRISERHFTNISCRNSQTIQIIWFTSGTCQISLDMQGHHICAGMVLCLRAGEVCQLTMAQNLEGFLIQFPTEFLFFGSELFSETQYNFTQSRLVRVDSTAQELLSEIVRSMQRELQYKDYQQQQVLRGLLRIFSIYLSRQDKIIATEPPRSASAALVKRFSNLLELHYKTQKRVCDYADLLSVTSNYLNEVIKKESGFSASSQIRKRLVMEAKRKAILPDVSLKSIAYDLGFADCAHFSKYFKQECGQTFTDYRKSVLE